MADVLDCDATAQAAQDVWESESEVEIETRALVVDVARHGLRLDKALSELVPELSRSYLQQLLAQGFIEVNAAARLKPAHKVKAGDAVVVQIRPTEQSQAFKPENIPLQVLHEDAHLLVLNKPAGLVVHPAPGHWSGTLLNALLGRDTQAQHLPRAGIVHRLDKDTSGLMVVARTRAAMDALVQKIAQREVSRQYLALAHRAWQGAAQRTVQAPIGRDPRNRLRMAVVDLAQHSGKTARTDFQYLAGNDALCLVRCTLHTGRTHQIRVHMAHIGHPLLADALYGGANIGALQRQALHAFRLAFSHPVTGQALEFHAPLPADMQQTVEQSGLGPCLRP